MYICFNTFRLAIHAKTGDVLLRSESRECRLYYNENPYLYSVFVPYLKFWIRHFRYILFRTAKLSLERLQEAGATPTFHRKEEKKKDVLYKNLPRRIW